MIVQAYLVVETSRISPSRGPRARMGMSSEVALKLSLGGQALEWCAHMYAVAFGSASRSGAPMRLHVHKLGHTASASI